MAFMIDVGVIFGVYTVSVSLVSFFLVSILQFDIPRVHTWPASEWCCWAHQHLGLLPRGARCRGQHRGQRTGRSESRVQGWFPAQRTASVSVITYPISFIVFGLGLLGIAFGKEHRAWHDKFAGTCEVYEWGKRSDAALPAPLTQWLEKRAGKV